MEEAKQRYSLGEAAACFVLGGIMSAILLVLVIVPVGLFVAWVRATIWNWFAVPYLHLPHISVWLMYAVTLFAATLTGGRARTMKKELYGETWGSYLLWSIAGNLLTLGVAWGLHITVLTAR
jgi:hypothetical protein